MNKFSMTAGFALVLLSACSLFNQGADEVKDVVDDVTSSEVRGRVSDNRGQPIEGATVRLFDLARNTNFVEGGDVLSAEAYIAREAVIASTNEARSIVTGADGTFTIDGAPITVFLASVTKLGCTADFAGFNEETGVLNLNTLLAPSFEGGLVFDIPAFTIACASPPEVGPEGNSPDAPPVEPPVAEPACDTDLCTAAQGTCEGDTCVITCVEETCEGSGGTCVEGACALPACDEAACEAVGGSCANDVCEVPECNEATCTEASGTCSDDGQSCDIPPCLANEAECTQAGGMCSADGSTCDLPACSSDADCEAGQAGARCVNPGDVALASCEPPLPGELVPPTTSGWTTLTVTDPDGTVLADAGAGNATLPADAIPNDGIVRLQAAYSGEATNAWVHVQSGSQDCPDLPPRTDSIPVVLAEGGGLITSQGDYLELVLHGGYQKLLVSTSEVVGEGDRSFAVDVGDSCAPPAHPLIAILSWDGTPESHADLDLAVWNGQGELVYIGQKSATGCRLALEGKGPGPEVFIADDLEQGPFTMKVLFFAGRHREVQGKLRVIRTTPEATRDDTYGFTLRMRREVVEIGVF